MVRNTSRIAHLDETSTVTVMKKIKRGLVVGLIAMAAACIAAGLFLHAMVKARIKWHKLDTFANDVFVYCCRHDALPASVDALYDEIAKETAWSKRDVDDFLRYIKANFDVQQVNKWEEVLSGADYVKAKPGASSDGDYRARVVNERLRWYLGVLSADSALGRRGAHRNELYRGLKQKATEGQGEDGKSEDGK